MAIQLFDNKFYEKTMTDILNTKIQTGNLMTLDTDLQGIDGMKKEVRKYTYAGEVEKLAKGAKSTKTGSVTFTTTTYEVERWQQKFMYNDVDVMTDSIAIDTGITGMAATMVNDINSKYFNELGKISNSYEYTVFNYDSVVDALASLNLEIEEGLFVVMGNDLKATIRKDDDYKSSRQGEILYTGQFGDICGVPVIYSKLVPAGTAYITRKDAVKNFVKKDVNIDSKHDPDSKDNEIFSTRYGLVALVDDTKSIKMTKKA